MGGELQPLARIRYILTVRVIRGGQNLALESEQVAEVASTP